MEFVRLQDKLMEIVLNAYKQAHGDCFVRLRNKIMEIDGSRPWARMGPTWQFLLSESEDGLQAGDFLFAEGVIQSLSFTWDQLGIVV